MSPRYLVLIALGGFFGAPARALLDRAVSARTRTSFPVGTLVVNCSGSFLLGVLTGLGLHHQLPFGISALAATGFCGAFTTFSTFSFETLRLLEDAAYPRAVLYVALSFAVGLAAGGAGLALGLAS
jgi:CrcB protein